MTSEEARELKDVQDALRGALKDKPLRYVLSASVALAVTAGNRIGYSEEDFLGVVRSTWKEGERIAWGRNMN